MILLQITIHLIIVSFIPSWTLWLCTCNNKLQVEWVLSSPVAGDARVNSCISASDRLDDQWVNSVLPHQHLVGRVWTDGLTIQLPDEVRSWQTTYLCFEQKQVKSNIFSIITSLPHYLCYKCNCPFKAFSNQSLHAWSVASVCVWFSWEMGPCTMPGICFQQLSHSWETQHLPHLKVCQRQTTNECACVFMFTRMGPKGVEWDACLSICIYCDVPENAHDICEHDAQVPFPWVCIFPMWCLQCPSCISLQPSWVFSWLLLKEQAV